MAQPGNLVLYEDKSHQPFDLLQGMLPKDVVAGKVGYRGVGRTEQKDQQEIVLEQKVAAEPDR